MLKDWWKGDGGYKGIPFTTKRDLPIALFLNLLKPNEVTEYVDDPVPPITRLFP